MRNLLLLLLLFISVCIAPGFADDEITLSCEAQEIHSGGQRYVLTGNQLMVISEYDVRFGDVTFLITEKNNYEIKGTAITHNATMEIQVNRATGTVRQVIGRNVLTYICTRAEPRF